MITEPLQVSKAPGSCGHCSHCPCVGLTPVHVRQSQRLPVLAWISQAGSGHPDCPPPPFHGSSHSWCWNMNVWLLKEAIAHVSNTYPQMSFWVSRCNLVGRIL